ncbi:MAG TPA: hypothetical protein VF062_24225 [Candidatus Limnocylindrales bacterium]
MSLDPPRTARAEYREAFWTLAAGAPVVLSVLRLWVESGGELQTTLLLASNVPTLNLVAALFVTGTQTVTMLLIAVLTVGGILNATVRVAAPESRLRTHVPLVAKLAAAAPPWFVIAIFGLALLTWRIFYLPLLVPAAVAVMQRPLWRVHDRLPAAIAFCLAVLTAYGILIAPAVMNAWTGGERLIVLLLVAPPLVAFGIAGPLPVWFARIFSVAGQLAIVVLAVVTFQAALSTPILPMVVTELRAGEGSPEFIRGNVVYADDIYLVVLEEQGGVRYIPTGEIKSTVLCATPEDIPAFGTRVRGFHVEDSLLTALGRQVRPQVRVDPACRIAPPPQNLTG